MANQAQWHLSGDYFENCNCSVVCPCFISKAAPLTSRPSEGVCNVMLIFHIETGSYAGTALNDFIHLALLVTEEPAHQSVSCSTGSMAPIRGCTSASHEQFYPRGTSTIPATSSSSATNPP